MGVHEDYTPRELFWMARAKRRDEWDRTASLLCMVHNLVAKRPLEPSDFHPMRLEQ